MFAPAVRPDLLRKMPRTGADAVVIDLEDATPPDAKDIGRVEMRSAVADLAGQLPILVRVNDDTTPWHDDDLDSLPTEGLAGIVVPKIETIAGLDSLAARLADRGLNMPVIGGVETALGVADARSLLAHDVISAGYFGAEDFVADLGGVRTASNDEVAYARAQIALAGRLANVTVIDQIVADFTDDDRCRRECLEARAMGYGGKLCIHPSQVSIANAAFLPSSEEIDRARRLLEAYDVAKAQGVASVAFEGQMVDEPVAVQARRVLAQADD
ncbi:MAG TPA: CoA ester lyase [Acidimicrobiaceae bacterium]|nr:CoA ester lyase [Acidimicrobiaceae bacterium]